MSKEKVRQSRSVYNSNAFKKVNRQVPSVVNDT